MNKSSRIIEKIKSVFPDETINELSKESGFVKRIRKIKPAYFLWSLVLGFGFGTERSIFNIRRVYERISGKQLVTAFYDRFHGGLVCLPPQVALDVVRYTENSMVEGQLSSSSLQRYCVD